MGKTSTEAKRRYNVKTYREFRAQIHIPLADSIDEALKEKGRSKTEFVRRAAKELLGVEVNKDE